MAKDSIKGVSVKIGADTSDFIKGLKSIDKEINQTQKTANELQKGLKLEYNEKNFVQAQKNIQKALESTENKAESIRKEMQKLEESGNVDTAGYRKLEEELAKTETKAIQLKEQLEEINKIKLESVYKGAENLSKGLETAARETAVFSAAAAGALIGANKLAKNAVATGDEIQTTADQYNLSAEAIQRWNYIALQSDVSADKLYKAMTKSRDAIGTALADGTSTGRKALESLIGDLSKVPTDTEGAFNSVITALAGVEDSTMQAYYANEIFGERVATELIPLLNQGADGIARLSQEFESVGYLTNEQVRNLADFDNELNKFNTKWSNTMTELGLALLPILEIFNDLLEEKVIPAIQWLTEKFNNLSPEMKQFIVYGLLAVAMLSPLLLGLSKIVGIFPNLIKGFGGLKKAFDSISKHPVILIIAVIAGVLLLLYTRNEEFRESVNKLLDLLMRSAMPVLNLVQSALEDIFTMLGPIIELLGNQLAPIIEFICVLLEPVVSILEYIFQLIGAINDGILTLLGKGWIWGKEGNVELKKTEEKNVTNTDIDKLLGDYKLPDYLTSSGNYTDQTSNYNDYSNVVINIEKNEYMSENDIIKAVNKGLKLAKQSRT
jgi:hypothetical protein